MMEFVREKAPGGSNTENSGHFPARVRPHDPTISEAGALRRGRYLEARPVSPRGTVVVYCIVMRVAAQHDPALWGAGLSTRRSHPCSLNRPTSRGIAACAGKRCTSVTRG